MVRMIKKVSGILIGILSPSILIFLFWMTLYLLQSVGIAVELGLSSVTVLYAVTTVGIVLFFKFKPCNIWILPGGFVLPVLIFYILDTLLWYNEWKHLATFLAAYFYSIPFIIISILIALVITLSKKRKSQENKNT